MLVLPAITFSADYVPITDLAGDIKIDGSDTVGKVAEVWVQEFTSLYPKVNISLAQQGSGDGAKALLAGTADIGSMSRKMKSKEKKAFTDKFGYKPTELRVGIDAVVVFSSQDVKVDALSIAQVDGLFSNSLKCKGQKINTLADLGITDRPADVQPSIFIRDSNSGTRAFFVKKALCGGSFKSNVQEFAHTKELLNAVSASKASFGFGGLADLTDTVSPIAISKKADSKPIHPSVETAASGKYPLSRYLFMYINKAPGQEFSPLISEFIKYSVSDQGQAALKKVGYVPLPKRAISRTLQLL